MPKGYIVDTKHVTDPEGIAAYSAAAAPSAIAAGGTVVIAGPAHASLKEHGTETSRSCLSYRVWMMLTPGTTARIIRP